jgi:hypothetical protein
MKRRKTVLILFLALTALPACRSIIPYSVTHGVDLTVNLGDKSVSATPDPVTTSKKNSDVVTWSCQTNPFLLEFVPASGLSDCQSTMKGDHWECKIDVFPNESPKGPNGKYIPFKYSVTAFDPADPNQQVAKSDPLIIVEK